jgi:hypothetical protein
MRPTAFVRCAPRSTLYVSLRGDDLAVVRRTDAERVARRYLDEIAASLPPAQGST